MNKTQKVPCELFGFFYAAADGGATVHHVLAVAAARQEIQALCRRQPKAKAGKPVSGAGAACAIAISLAVVDGYSATNDVQARKR